MIYTICNRCNKKVPYGSKCSCQDKYNKERYKDYNRNRRNKDSQKFYNSSSWRDTRDRVNNMYNHICLKCLMDNGDIKQADVIHHIQEYNIRPDLGTNINNLIPLCFNCHNSIHSNTYGAIQQQELMDILVRYRELYII